MRDQKSAIAQSMNQQRFQTIMRSQIFPVTTGIALGPFATDERARELASFAVTHVLNVGDVPPRDVCRSLFRETLWLPVVDRELIAASTATTCLDALHGILQGAGRRVYVHCVAGWNRCPTIVWLYLVACGMQPESTRQEIGRRAPDAIPAHPKMIDAELVEAVREHGRRKFLPHPCPELLEWAEELRPETTAVAAL